MKFKNLQELENIPKNCISSKIEKITNVKSNDYTVIEKITYKLASNNYRYYYIIKCNKCGALKKIDTSDWKNARIRKCSKCMIKEDQQSFVGYENKVYKVLAFDEKKSTNKKRFYKVQCKNCGKILSLRKDSIIDVKGTKCSKCKGNNKTANPSAVINIFYGRYKQGAIYRGMNWELSKEDFINLINSNCFYCGQEPTEMESLKRYNKTNQIIKVNGIDRIDSSKGYNKDNCVTCCEMCNRMKLNYSLDNFKNHICKIYKHIISSTTIPQGSTSQANGDGNGECPNKDNDIV